MSKLAVIYDSGDGNCYQVYLTKGDELAIKNILMDMWGKINLSPNKLDLKLVNQGEQG